MKILTSSFRLHPSSFMYQVIARKWRPQTFEQVTGQEPITRTLVNAIEHDRLHHAYIFSGARGVGKTTTARLLAKAVNCHKSDKPTANPCAFTDPEACASCREIAEGRSIDVLEIDAASNTGVDNVRDSIIATVGIRPARDRYKVFVIDEVHMLSGAAFNALLKTLEEPPPRVLFIMATTEAHKIPDTILSRSQQFEFRTIAVLKIAERLRRIADAEKINVAEDALREIARAGEGSMRDAQSAFDQVISFSGERITPEDVEVALGLAGTELLRRTMRAVAERQPAEALAVVDQLVARGHDLRNFTRDLLAHTRDLLVARVEGKVDDREERDAGTSELAARFSESDLVRFFHSLTATERDLRESAHPRYQLELGLVKLIEMRRLAQLDDVLRRLTDLETSLRANGAGGATSGGGLPPAVGGASLPPRPGGARGALTPRQGFAPSSAPQEAAPQTTTHVAVAQATSAQAVAPPAPISQASAPGTSPLTTSSGQAPAFAPAPPASVTDDDVPWFEPPLAPAANASGLKLVTPTASAPKTQDAYARDSAAASASQHAAPASDVERIIAELELRRPFVAFALSEAQRVTIEDDEICIELTPKTRHLRDNLIQPDSRKALLDACRNITNRELGFKIAVRDPSEAVATPDAPLSPEEQQRRRAEEERAALWREAEAHPTIQAFKRIFRGEVTDVWREPTADASGNKTNASRNDLPGIAPRHAPDNRLER